MAPEVYYCNNLSPPTYDPFAADCWSLACTLYLMLTGSHLYVQPATSDPYFLYIMNGRLGDLITALNFQQVIPPAAQHLLGSLLNMNAAQRPDIEAIAAHPWLQPARNTAPETTGNTGGPATVSTTNQPATPSSPMATDQSNSSNAL
jgi:serine/threonine protein kinase